MKLIRPRGAAVSLAVLAVIGVGGEAFATNVKIKNASTVPVPQTGTGSSTPTAITITGEADPGVPGGEAIVLDGDYVVAAGGTRTTAVLGVVSFDPAGTVIEGALSFIGASSTIPEPAPTETTTTMLTATTLTASGGDDVAGGDDTDPADPTAPAPSGSATVTDCTVTGGTYTLATGGAGEAQLQLDCAGSSLAATWRLFVTGSGGLAVAQQFRAVQLEALPGASDAEIVDLTLTLR